MKSSFLLLFCLIAIKAVACPFCDPEIIKRQSVLETENFHVLADYAPINYGHMLIVPKKHIERLDELDPRFGEELLLLQRRVSRAFKDVLCTQDTTLIEKNGKAAGQSVPHMHFHLIPMKPKKWQTLAHLRVFLRILFGSRAASPEELERVVSEFRDYFQNKK